MLKARTSFPSVIYENNEHHNESGHVDRVADIMARYYTRIDEIFQAEVLKQNEFADIQPADIYLENSEQSQTAGSTGRSNAANTTTDTARLDTRKYLDIIKKSRLKVKKISTAFSKTDEDMKKLEDDGQLLSTVRENLDDMDCNFWGWLSEDNPETIIEPAPLNPGS